VFLHEDDVSCIIWSSARDGALEFIVSDDGMQPGWCQVVRHGYGVVVLIEALMKWAYFDVPTAVAFPSLSPVDRTFLTTGLTPDEQLDN
jgi:hypothetical protein